MALSHLRSMADRWRYDSAMQVCRLCFGESAALKERFDTEGSPGICPTCGSKVVRILEASELADLFAGIEAYYEPLCGNSYTLGKEGIYGIGPGIGEDSLVEVLREDWDVFSDRISDTQAEGILECVWPDYVGEYLRRPSNRLREVRSELDEVKHHLHDGQLATNAFHQILDPWVESLGSSRATLTWCRARIQDSRGRVFPSNSMGGPPPDKARAGRANPKGVPFLYVSSDEATAVAELRAEPADWVTVAEVKIPRKGSWVLDLSRDVRIIDPFALTDLDEALMVREFLQYFAGELSRPVRARDQATEYVSTQAISTYFRDRGYSGIVLPSSLSNGTNAVFFDPTVATITNPVQRAVWSKELDVVDDGEFDRRGRQRRGLPY